jgi:N-dimethylarginine dimethylaminohydrolase
MTEMYTTPRENESNAVKKILRENDIKFYYRMEDREFGWRHCIYVHEKNADRAYTLIDEGLLELGI